jgi:photosynthetic reaction center cytochrome c subunit
MKVMHRRFLCGGTIVFVLLSISAKPPLAQTATANSLNGKSAGEVYHNIQVLKDIPADDLIPAMQFITYSMGVECSYCHVEGALEKDDKKPKLTARKMMQMMIAINRNNFDSKQVVTCNSCHHGAQRPVSIPMIANGGVKPISETSPAIEADSVNTLPPDEIIARYVDAIGGAAALAKVKTREEKGAITISGRNLPLEILASAGGKQLTRIHLPNGDSITAYDGTSGWTSAPNRPTRPIPSVEVVSARSETDLQLPLHMKQLFGELKSLPPEDIGDRETYVVAGINSGEIAAKFYFDKNSGYLLRILRYTKTPLGQSPTQIDYEDYRDQNGVKVPFRFMISRPNSRLAVQIEEVQLNVPIDDAKFAQPVAAPVPSPPSQ